MAKKCSEKKFAIAVALSGVFGVLGIHHFYLGRHLEGALDLVMSMAALYFFLTDQIFMAIFAFALDYIHTLVVTIMLLTGSFKDGQGRYVCYPGQKL